jgi:hypothetical protein
MISSFSMAAYLMYWTPTAATFFLPAVFEQGLGQQLFAAGLRREAFDPVTGPPLQRAVSPVLIPGACSWMFICYFVA